MSSNLALESEESDGVSNIELLTRKSQRTDSQRIFVFAKYQLDEDGTLMNVTELETNLTNLQLLEKAFKPYEGDDVKNSVHCGYYFQPYDTVRFLVSDYKPWSYESYVCLLLL